MFYVYKMIHIPTGRVYIGQHKIPKGRTPENDNYFGSGKIWKRIYKSHKQECVKVILEVVDSKTKVDDLEKKYIAHYRAVWGDYCVNIADGGDGGYVHGIVPPMLGKKHSESTKQKIAEAQIGEKNHFFGKKHSQETIKKMSLVKKGKHLSEESRKKISEALSGEKSPNFGKQFSEEHRRKLSEAHKGKTPWNKGKKHSEESKRKMSEAHKARRNRKDNA